MTGRRSYRGPEDLARRCIAATLDVEVHHHDTEDRESADDLHFTMAGREHAVEVKRLVDPKYRAAEDHTLKGGYTTDGRLTRSWTMRLRHTVRWKDASSAALGLLLRLEELGWQGPTWQLRDVDRHLRDDLETLGVEYVHSGPPTAQHPPGYYLMPEGWGGAVPTSTRSPPSSSGSSARTLGASSETSYAVPKSTSGTPSCSSAGSTRNSARSWATRTAFPNAHRCCPSPWTPCGSPGAPRTHESSHGYPAAGG